MIEWVLCCREFSICVGTARWQQQAQAVKSHTGGQGSRSAATQGVNKKRPHRVSTNNVHTQGVNRQRPHTGCQQTTSTHRVSTDNVHTQGVNKQRPHRVSTNNIHTGCQQTTSTHMSTKRFVDGMCLSASTDTWHLNRVRSARDRNQN